MSHFTNCQTMDEATREYKRVIFSVHPDRRPKDEQETATRETQELNAEFADFCAHFAAHAARQRQEAAHAEGKKSAADFHDIDGLTEILRQKIEAALNMGLNVELCGLWVWVTGETKAHKEELKALEFKWAHKKAAWYFAGVPSFNRSEKSLDAIRAMYGSQKFEKRQDRQEDYESLSA